MNGSPLLIWGAGAIGGTVGAYWRRAGHEVLFVDRDADHVAAINQSGLTLNGPIEEFTVKAQAVLPKDVKGTAKVGDKVTVYYKMVATEIEAKPAGTAAATKKK